jgi:hypothetical protein
MRATLSSAGLASANAERTAEVWLVLLEANHPNLSQPIRVCTNNANITSNGHEYIAIPFEVELPGEDPEQPGKARIKIDNMDPVIIDTLRTITTPPTVVLRVILASQPNVIEAEFAGLVMRNCEYDASEITAELLFESILVEPVALSMTPNIFPGLF